MKKTIAFLFIALVGVMCAVSASPLPLAGLFALPAVIGFNPNYYTLGIGAADLSAISTYAAVNQMPLISTLVNGLDVVKDISVYPNVKNKIPMPKLTVGSGFRPYGSSDDWKNSDLTYTDRTLEVRVGKRDLMIDVESYRKTYLMWAQSPGSGATQKDIPFAQYMWMQVIKRIQAEINDETTWKGFDNTTATAYNAGTVYTAGQYITYASTSNNPNSVADYWLCLATTTAGQSPDSTPAKWQNVSARAVCPGLESYLLTEISGSAIAPVVTGAITDGASALTAFTAVFRAFSVPYKNWGVLLTCSFKDFEFLMDGLLNTYGKYTLPDTLLRDGNIILPNTNQKCFVRPASWLGTSRRIVGGPIISQNDIRHMNLFLGTDVLNDLSTINVLTQAKLHQILASVQAAIGFQIQDVNAIRVNDQA